MKNLIQSVLRKTGYSVFKTASFERLAANLHVTQSHLDESMSKLTALGATLDAVCADRDRLAVELVESEQCKEKVKSQKDAHHQFSCPCCESQSYAVTVPGALLPHLGGVEMLRCADCSAEMFWPIPSAKELVAYYTRRNSFSDLGDGDAARYLADPEPVRRWASSLGRQLNELGISPDARVLELGCMHGALSIEMRKLGYDAWGIEPSRAGVKFLTEHGGRAYCGTLFDDGCPVKTCDVAMSFHVFEHLPNPYEAIRRLHHMMPAGGVLHFIVPHWGGLVAQQRRQGWKWLAYPEHLHYFSREPLVKFLESTGFKMVDVNTTSADHEIDEALESLHIEQSRRDESTRRAILQLLQLGACGEALSITAVRL